MQNILFLIVFFIIYEQFRYQIYLYIYRLEPSLPANVRSEASWFLEQAWLKNDQRQAVGYAVVTRRFQKKTQDESTVEVEVFRDVWGRSVFCWLEMGHGR